MNATSNPDPSETAIGEEPRRSWHKWGAAGLLWATCILRGLAGDLNVWSIVRSLILFGVGMLVGKLSFRNSRTRVVVFWVSAVVLFEAAFGLAVHLYGRSVTREALSVFRTSAPELSTDAPDDSLSDVLYNDIHSYRLTTESLVGQLMSVTDKKSPADLTANLAVLQKLVSFHDSFAEAHLAHWSTYRSTVSPGLHPAIDSLMIGLKQYYDCGHQSLVATEQVHQFLRQHSSHWDIENGKLAVDDSPEMERLFQMVDKTDSLAALEASLKSTSMGQAFKLLAGVMVGGEVGIIDTTGRFVRKEPSPVEADIPVVPFWKVEVKPKPINIPVPTYPDKARTAGIDGRNIVEVLVDTDGSVADARILKSSGDALLDEAAVDAALRATFTPGRQENRAVRVWVSIPFRFTLEQ